MLRKILIGKDKQKGFFHQFYIKQYTVGESLLVGGHSAGQVSGALAIVELEDGQVIEVNACDIKFDDKLGEEKE